MRLTQVRTVRHAPLWPPPGPDAKPVRMTDRTGPEHVFALHRHGFVRVAAATPRVRPADVGFNRDAILEQARRADAARADLVVFPELSVSSYAIDDLHLQAALLDAVEAAVAAIVAASADLAPVLLIGAPLRRDGRLYNCALVDLARASARGGAEELPAELPRVLREALVRPRPRHRRGQHPGRRAGGAVRAGPDLRRRRPRRLRAARRDLRGLLGRDPALDRGGAGRRHDPRQPVGLEHHHRQVRRAPPALPLAVGPRRRGLRLFGGRAGREHHRPRLGRAGGDLRARRPAGRVGALPDRAGALHRRRRHRPHPRRADADADLQRRGRPPRRPDPAVPPHRLRPPAELRGRRPDPADPPLPLRAEPAQPSRPGLLRGLQHPGRGPAPPLRVDRRRAHGDRRLGRARTRPTR